MTHQATDPGRTSKQRLFILFFVILKIFLVLEREGEQA